MNLNTVHLCKNLICIVLLTAVVAPAQVQDDRRQGTELDLLRSEAVLREIGMSSEGIAQIEEIRRKTTTTRAVFERFKEKLRSATTDEERSAVRQEIQAAVKAGGVEFQQQALQQLSADQRKQLRRVYIENYGSFALADDRVAADLDLSPEQRSLIKQLIETHRQQELDEELSTEERDTAEKAANTALFGVLSNQQLEVWTQQSGNNVTGKTFETHPVSSSPTSDPASADSGNIESVASFGPASAGSFETVQSFSFNFRHAPWERVLQMFADGTGLTLDMQRVPPGTLSHLDTNEYTASRALDIMNGYLIRKGFGIVEKDGFLIVVNLDEQLDQSLIPEVTLEDLRKVDENSVVGDHQLVTVRVPVEGLDTGRTAQEVEALLGPWGSLIALTQSQVMMVTDIGANLRRIMGLLESAARPDALVFTAYHLRNIDVEDAEPLLLTQFGMRQAATNVSAAAESRNRRERRRSRDSRSRDSRTTTPTDSAPAEALQVASDVRTNSLLVTGTAVQHLLVETIISAIDVSESPSGQPLSRTGRRGKYLMVYEVSSADAREVTKTLDAIMPGIVVNEDGRNGRIHIMATEREHDEVAQLIRQLDGPAGRQSVAVIPLIRMDPLMAAATLRSLFLSDGANAPTLEPDLYERRLIVRGDPDQVAQIKAILAQLGEDGSGLRPPGRGELRRRYSLHGRSPNEFLQLLQGAWEDSEPNPIRIVVPSRSGPLRERRTSDGAVESSTHHQQQEETRNNAANADHNAAAAGPVFASDFDYLPVALSDEAPSDSTMKAEEVVITVFGDDLLLTSNDPDALDRLEELLDALQQTLPFRTRWTVFYLQAADATEAADMLRQIFPGSSVSSTTASEGGSILGSLTSSVSGIGSSLVAATGLTRLAENPQALRIIPDVRSNSLLISGPNAVLQDVWALLNVLDSNDIPESFRDMQQRTIALMHADIDNVAAILRDVYKPLLEAENSSRQRQQENPLAAMFGSSGNRQKTQNVRMTLGVDRRTSSLVVSSSQEVFDDVKKLVETLDKNAMSANRRIRVVQLRSARPADVQRSLTGMFPRISTSVMTSRNTGTGGSSTNQERQQNNQQAQQTEAIRRIRERIERRRQNETGTGRTGNGRRGGRPLGR